MDFFTFVDNAALLLALSLLSFNIQFRWLKTEPAKSIVLGFLYGFFSFLAMSNPVVLAPGVIFDGRSVILSLAGLFAGNVTTAIACVITAAARIYLGGQGVFTGVGAVVISSLAGIIFRKIVDQKNIPVNFANLFKFGFCVHLALIFWFFTLPLEIAMAIIENVALSFLTVFPLATMLIGGFMEEQQQRLIIEENLAASEKRYRNLVNTLNEGVWEIDADHITTFMNPKMAAMLGYKPKEVFGISIFDFVPKQDLQQINKYISRRIQGINKKYELRLIQKNGSILHALVGATPLFDEHGIYCGLLAGVQDITELKHTQAKLARQSSLLEEKVEERTRELKEAQAQLLKAEKMAALGELAGSVGHELRNPLAVILNSMYLLKQKFSKSDEQITGYIAMIEKEIHNASQIIKDLLDYSRIQITSKEEVDLSSLLAAMLLKRAMPENIKLENEIAGNTLPVNANPQQLGQIFDNLITNAVEAMPDGGILKFTSNIRKNKLFFHIVDSGTGIPRKNLKKIFEPLFTTKPRGIGLGLAITCKLAELNDISIQVKSKVGKGTTFTLIFLIRI